MLTLSENEKKLLSLATVGGKTIEEAYSMVYKTKGRKSLLTAVARKQKRSPQLFDQINKYKSELFEKAKTDHRNAVLDACKQNAITIIEKREILRKIIAGESEGEELLIIKGVPKKVRRSPSLYEVIRAIELDCKIAGHFAPTTLKHEGGDSFMEFIKAFATNKNKNIPDVVGAD
jgi:predicted CopG family antitoxin